MGPEKSEPGARPVRSTGRYLLIGLLTAALLAITWWILDFLFSLLARVGKPWVFALSQAIRPRYPEIADLLHNEILQSVAAAAIVLGLLCVLGWATGRVVGQRLIRSFESLIGMIPFVDRIYRATKRFLAVAGTTPTGERRVVLIQFPSRDMKTVGIVTRTLHDSATGEELGAVYIPTSPNPTSGYIEIVPVRSLIFTDWTFDQAMSFIVTGGSNAPETIPYSGTPGRPPTESPAKPPAESVQSAE